MLLNIHTQASTVKIIHDWNTTYAKLRQQGREPSAMCPRHHTLIEIRSHMSQCQAFSAMVFRIQALTTVLSALVHIYTPLYIIATLKSKLSMTLIIPFEVQYSLSMPMTQTQHSLILSAVHHQI